MSNSRHCKRLELYCFRVKSVQVQEQEEATHTWYPAVDWCRWCYLNSGRKDWCSWDCIIAHAWLLATRVVTEHTYTLFSTFGNPLERQSVFLFQIRPAADREGAVLNSGWLGRGAFFSYKEPPERKRKKKRKSCSTTLFRSEGRKSRRWKKFVHQESAKALVWEIGLTESWASVVWTTRTGTHSEMGTMSTPEPEWPKL